jgi:hypothetical protein
MTKSREDLYQFAKEVIDIVAPNPLCSIGYGVIKAFNNKSNWYYLAASF